MKKFLILLLMLAAFAATGLAVWQKGAHTAGGMRVIIVGNVSVAADVADTASLRERGLSGRASLPAGKGMLFVFDTEGIWGIWMKDMRFPIDIVWADSSGAVVTVASYVAPETYPKIFYPIAPARYAVELPAGFAAANGIVEGSLLTL